MYAVIITVLLFVSIVMSIVIGIIKYYPTEGFSAMSQQKDFGSKQITYYHESLDQAVLTNPGINPENINKAAFVPDLSIYLKKFKDYIPRFMEDKYNAYDQNDREFCKKATNPRNLPKREPKATVGCGWYFSPNSSYPSVGVLGTMEKPLFTENLPPNGTWFWDISKAIEQEDIKKCVNIRSYDVMDIDGIRGVCGFCLTSGHAVPIDSAGNEKYPNNPQGACGVKIAKTAYECLNPPPAPVYTTDGVNCKRYGYPSELNDIRLYKKEECSALAGKWSGNGECLKPKGGSFSWDCRSLNIPKPVVKTACTPNSQGKLSHECLITLAKNLGFLPGGRIMNILKRKEKPTRNDRAAMNLLASIGVAIPDSVLGAGNTDAVSAGNVYKRIVDQIQRGNTEQIRNAAKLLVIGGDSFDGCNINTESRGPFAAYCVQQAFRRAGCQPAGSEYPTRDLITDKLWGRVVGEYKELYAAMDNHKDPVEQKRAIKKCLGITVPDMKIDCKR